MSQGLSLIHIDVYKRQVLVPAARRRLVAGFGIPMADILIVEWDGGDVFVMLCVEGEAARQGCDDTRACALRSGVPDGRSSFLAWARPAVDAMLEKVEAVAGGVWAGLEGGSAHPAMGRPPPEGAVPQRVGGHANGGRQPLPNRKPCRPCR